ncbi:MAG: tetratricopeptide repeat protein [Bacteroidota bacterium]
MKDNMLRWVVIIGGGIVFILLLFADKTNLTNLPEAVIQSSASPAGGSKLPPLGSDPKLDEWIAALSELEGAQKARLLDSVVSRLADRGRFAYAADYGEQLLTVENNIDTKRRLGILNYRASKLTFVSSDPELFGKYSSRGIQLLEEVISNVPNDEPALLNLGLAYTESRQQQNSMKGILTIRKVLELNPDNVEASFMLGMFSIQTQQWDKAKSRFEKVLELEPENAQANFQLGYVLLQLDNSVEARGFVEKAIELSTDPELTAEARALLNTF